MKIVNLYAINGLIDSNGNYIPNKETHTLIAECTSDNLDSGCYYFAFLSFRNSAFKKNNNYSLAFIEIPNLLTFLNKNSSINLKKVIINEQIKNQYEIYINQTYEARSKVHKLDLSQNTEFNDEDKLK